MLGGPTQVVYCVELHACCWVSEIALCFAPNVALFIGGELGAPPARTVGAHGPTRGGAAPSGAPGAAAPSGVLLHIDELFPWFPCHAVLARGSVL